MGGGRWDSGTYASAASVRTAKGLADFGYDADVKAGRAVGIHDSLDPKKVAGPTSPLAGTNVRESRDIPGEHEESLPVMVFFDVTGSMGEIPMRLQKKLTGLMDTIIEKAGIVDSQILVGAIGDSTCDRYPFQVGQFESDNRFDEALRSIIVERGGGGQNMESYGLAWYFAAYHTATDAWEKRGKKGYCITIGDEKPWPTVPRDHAIRIFGDSAAGEIDEKVEDLLSKTLERFEVYHIIPMRGSAARDPDVQARWKQLLDERLVFIEDDTLICEVISGLIYGLETAKGLDTVVDDMGLTGASRDAVKNALVPIMENRVPSARGEGSLPDVGSATDGVARI